MKESSCNETSLLAERTFQVVVDTSCPPDACKLLCATWINLDCCGKAALGRKGNMRETCLKVLFFLLDEVVKNVQQLLDDY